MQLLTQEIRRALPKLYTQESNPDPMIVAKFFYPASRFTWYVLEGEEDGADVRFFGYVQGNHPQDDELGYFTLRQLEGVRGPLSLKVERDVHWAPVPLSAVRGY